jgi:hypothetical protein
MFFNFYFLKLENLRCFKISRTAYAEFMPSLSTFQQCYVCYREYILVYTFCMPVVTYSCYQNTIFINYYHATVLKYLRKICCSFEFYKIRKINYYNYDVNNVRQNRFIIKVRTTASSFKLIISDFKNSFCNLARIHIG